jgi:cardiolipin synthase
MTIATVVIRSSPIGTTRRLLALATLALAGCSALPVITPDMARVDPEGVQFQAASGRILSPEHSRELVAQLAASDPSPDALARHLALEQAVSDTPLVLGNRVVLLENGPSTYAAMLAAIASARDSINMETYIIDDDDVGNQFADALIAKQAAGVQVNLIYDGVGALRTSKAFFERLRGAGVQVLEFNPVNPLVAKSGWA